MAGILKELLLSEGKQATRMVVAGRAALYLVLLVWGVRFITASVATGYAANSVMHLVNLPFHEAGHLFFRPLGLFVSALGGSLAQLLMPLICLGTFLLKMRNPFGAAVCLWWVGQNFMDMAPYIADARAMRLILLGGVTGHEANGYHDWNFILGRLDWLEHDLLLAGFAHGAGTICMLLFMVWGGVLLINQFRNLQNPAAKNPVSPRTRQTSKKR
jgi:hypothetical protein